MFADCLTPQHMIIQYIHKSRNFQININLSAASLSQGEERANFSFSFFNFSPKLFAIFQHFPEKCPKNIEINSSEKERTYRSPPPIEQSKAENMI